MSATDLFEKARALLRAQKWTSRQARVLLDDLQQAADGPAGEARAEPKPREPFQPTPEDHELAAEARAALRRLDNALSGLRARGYTAGARLYEPSGLPFYSGGRRQPDLLVETRPSEFWAVRSTEVQL